MEITKLENGVNKNLLNVSGYNIDDQTTDKFTNIHTYNNCMHTYNCLHSISKVNSVLEKNRTDST